MYVATRIFVNPRIISVTTKSKKTERARPLAAAPYASAVIVPELADLTMQVGGFTGSRVAEHLQTHCHAPNKQLVAMDQPILVQDNTSIGVFDSCDCVTYTF
mgnify:CR=1 FL=1